MEKAQNAMHRIRLKALSKTDEEIDNERKTMSGSCIGEVKQKNPSFCNYPRNMQTLFWKSTRNGWCVHINSIKPNEISLFDFLECVNTL